MAEDCQGRFPSLPLLHKHMQLVLSQRLFDWLCSLLEPFLNTVVVLLYPTGDDWANCSNGSHVYIDFGVQGKEVSSVVFKSISSFFKRNNKSLSVYLEGLLRCRALLMVIIAVCIFGCHAMLKAFEETSNLWPSSHPPFQSKVLLHLHFLLLSHCTAHVLGHWLWLRKDDTFSAQQIHHCKRLDTLLGASELTLFTKVHW